MLATLTILLMVSAQIWASTPTENVMHLRLPPISKSSLNPNELKSSYWTSNAQNTLNEKINRPINKNVAKNVILFLGDGLSIPTIAAARVYLGGEEAELSFDKFPYTALSKTYAVDRQVADSANTATAYLCGVKANYGTIGVGPEVAHSDCLGMADETYHTPSIAYYSQLKNKRTGLVTTSRVTHASPGGVYAHTSNRDWESDTDILDDAENPLVCTDIASQLVNGKTGKNLNVVLGGGKAGFLPSGYVDEEGRPGKRSDGVNLIQEFLEQKDNAEYIWNRNQLLALGEIDNLLGLFSDSHMDYNVDRNTTYDPSLAEMTKAAIEILSKGDNGYFLFVEGARIDMAHHDTQARIALDETIEFSKAVQTAVDMTNEADTLIVVTADHSHTLSYSGYPQRGNDIFGFAGTASDSKVYATLSYANGPGYRPTEPDGSRHDHERDDYHDAHYTYPASAPLSSETHGGDDVAIFARGPWAHLFTGVLEQNTIPHLMSFASCVGEGLTACDSSPSSSSYYLFNKILLFLFPFFVLLR